jgi:hypothetical protein
MRYFWVTYQFGNATCGRGFYQTSFPSLADIERDALQINAAKPGFVLDDRKFVLTFIFEFQTKLDWDDFIKGTAA